jgi:hypothetical protein
MTFSTGLQLFTSIFQIATMVYLVVLARRNHKRVVSDSAAVQAALMDYLASISNDLHDAAMIQHERLRELEKHVFGGSAY